MVNIGDLVRINGFSFTFTVVQKQTFSSNVAGRFAVDLNTKVFGTKNEEPNSDEVIQTVTLLHVYENNYAEVKNLVIEGVGVEACIIIERRVL